MLQRIRRGGQARVCEAGRKHARLRRPADLEGFGQTSEVGNKSASHRRRDGECCLRFLRAEVAKFSTGGRRGDSATDCSRVPALLVQRHRLTDQELDPDLVTRNISGEQFRTACAEGFTLGDDTGNEHGAGMAVERDIVIVEDVRCRAVHERCIFDITLLKRRNQGGQHPSIRPCQLPVEHVDGRFARARDHHAETVGDPSLGNGLGRGGHVLERQIGYEAAKVSGEGWHNRSLLRAGTMTGSEAVNIAEIAPQ